MAKTLKQLLSKTEAKPYDPESASAGDKAFVAKHKVDKIADANGNEDDVFNATNVKQTTRALHGYTDAGDNSVYESKGDDHRKGNVYHSGTGEDRAFFVHSGEYTKDGRSKGLVFDGGAAGRGRKKPVSQSVHTPYLNNSDAGRNNMPLTPADEIPDYVKKYIKESAIYESSHKLTKKQREHLDKTRPFGKLTTSDFKELQKEEHLEEGEVIQAKFSKKPPRKAGSAPASVTKLDSAAKEARDVAKKVAFFKALTGTAPSPEDIAKWNSMVSNKLKESVERHLAEASIETISKKFYKNEDNNFHTENAILLAKHFGTPEEVSAAKAAKKARDTEGGYSGDSPHLNTVYKIHKKYGNKILPYEESK